MPGSAGHFFARGRVRFSGRLRDYIFSAQVNAQLLFARDAMRILTERIPMPAAAYEGADIQREAVDAFALQSYAQRVARLARVISTAPAPPAPSTDLRNVSNARRARQRNAAARHAR